jgi:23S rRNA pseudouridine1911/1915/1917 synthase
MEQTLPQIIHKEKDFLILNKPAGMIVNNADTSKKLYTVQDFIKSLNILDKKVENADGDFIKREGIVHRLDKETSGVLIVALNENSFKILQKQFKEKKVKKTYLALCHGKLVEAGEINVPIGRLPWNRMRFGVIPSGRESFTQFKVKDYKSFKIGKKEEVLSLVEVYPQTGRTHQIRVHFQYVGHPLFADNLYAGRKTKNSDRKYLKRHFLHASKISFLNPSSSKRVEYDAPLSLDLSDFLSSLKSNL